jgi:UrcA family protein
MSKFRSSIILAAAAAALAAFASAAIAQSTPADGVTVTAPRAITGRDAIGAAIEQVNMTSIVRITDLDMKTEKGAAELDKRVADAAHKMCRELETLYPVGNPDANTCAQRAIRGASNQVKAAKGRG